LIDIIPSFRNLKNAKIEPLIIPHEKLQELKTVLANTKSPETHKAVMMRQISGSCLVCGRLPSHIAKYRIYGATVIEKYCDECLIRMKII
jgi:hypothetical protein